MPRLGFRFSDESKAKMRESHLGLIPWNKGVTGYKMAPCSEETKRKISIANSIALKGKKQSIETRKKRSLSFRAKRNHQWIDGRTPFLVTLRKSIEYRLWREAVYERDNYTCQLCGERGFKLNADHIKPFSLFPELRFTLENGRTLCVECHRKVTKEQHKTGMFPNAVKTRFRALTAQ